MSCNHTVDGSEIRRPPVDVEKLLLFIYMVLYMSGGAGFLPSIVVGKYPNAGYRRLVATSDHQ